MNDLTEHALLSHVEASQFIEIVAAVLKHHTMPAGALRSVHKSPALLNRSCSRHLDCHMLSVLHCIHSHFGVILPWNCQINQIDIIPLTKLHPCILTYIFSDCPWRTVPLKKSLSTLHLSRIKVAERNDCRIINIRKTHRDILATVTQTDYAHTDIFDRITRKTEH